MKIKYIEKGKITILAETDFEKSVLEEFRTPRKAELVFGNTPADLLGIEITATKQGD